ncbi:hypothetical protein BAE44_0019972 [Dichanthelium oligosanthes]|uniref:MADS-box domain-containing protein n=1 Tax=Dichanthelium oligosanthes TaxID=888268 RepID=A0A1E5V1J1_9POAL|nr:hypothetical protein BAE44_0019972 [Dichanthelium oligosanthes]
MGRKKVNLQWITNTLTRRAAFKKRSKGLLKKASELETLCGAKACVVVYVEGEVQPEVWPADHEEARLRLTKYRDMPELGNFKKTENLKDFLDGRITKLRGQVNKSESENYKREILDLLHERINKHRLGLFNTSNEELTSLRKILVERSSEAKERLRQLGVGQGAPQDHRLQLLPGSSSQPQDPNTCAEMQMLAPAEEPQPQQQDWVVGWAPNGEELSTLRNSALLGSSSDCAGPSSSGDDMMQRSNPGCYSAFPWTCEWNSFGRMN